MGKRIASLFVVMVLWCTSVSFCAEAVMDYPTAQLRTTNEYDLNVCVGENVSIDFAPSYDDESEEAKWWRDNGRHYLQIRTANSSNDYNGYIKKFDANRYTWGETYYSDEIIETGWDFVAEAEPGQTSCNIGTLPLGRYIVIVVSDYGIQYGVIIAKYNVTVSETENVFDISPKSGKANRIVGKNKDGSNEYDYGTGDPFTFIVVTSTEVKQISICGDKQDETKWHEISYQYLRDVCDLKAVDNGEGTKTWTFILYINEPGDRTFMVQVDGKNTEMTAKVTVVAQNTLPEDEVPALPTEGGGFDEEEGTTGETQTKPVGAVEKLKDVFSKLGGSFSSVDEMVANIVDKVGSFFAGLFGKDNANIDEALPSAKILVLGIGESVGYRDGEQIEVPNPPYLKSDRTLIPLKLVANSFGATVEWEAETQTVIVKNQETVAKYVVGKKNYQVQGTYYVMNNGVIQPEYTDIEKTFAGVSETVWNKNEGTTFVPIKALCETVFGLYINYIDNIKSDQEGVLVIYSAESSIESDDYYTTLISPHVHQWVSNGAGKHSCSICGRTWKCEGNPCKKCGYMVLPDIPKGMSKSFVIDSRILSNLTNDQIYYAPAYKENHESAVYRALGWIGNNVYGDTHNEKLVYKRLLIEYFDNMNSSEKEENETIEAVQLLCKNIDSTISILKGLYDHLKPVTKLMDSATQAELKEICEMLEFLSSEKQNIFNMFKNYRQTPDFWLKKIDSINEQVGPLLKKHSSLSEKLSKSNKIQLTILGETTGKVLTTLDITVSVYECINTSQYNNQKDYITMKNNISNIQDNIYVLDAIINTTNNKSLKQAAKELKVVGTDCIEDIRNSIKKQFKEEVTINTSFVVIEKIAELVPYVKWFELSTEIANWIIPVGELSKYALEAYGLACMADSLADDITKYYSKYKQGNMYVFKDEKAQEAYRRFRNLAYMRIVGEKKVIQLHSLDDGIEPLLKELRKLLGTDAYQIIQESYVNIDRANAYINKYNLNINME